MNNGSLQSLCPMADSAEASALVMNILAAMQQPDAPSDVTPASVMVDQDMHVSLSSADGPDLSFKAPEELLQASLPAGQPQQLYTLGALIYFVYTGQAPCHSSAQGLFDQPDESLLPPSLQEGVMALLCPRPEDRSADRLLEALRQAPDEPASVFLMLADGSETPLLELAAGHWASFEVDILQPTTFNFKIRQGGVVLEDFCISTGTGTRNSILTLSAIGDRTLSCVITTADNNTVLTEQEILF